MRQFDEGASLVQNFNGEKFLLQKLQLLPMSVA
jgi:hypothetical protein